MMSVWRNILLTICISFIEIGSFAQYKVPIIITEDVNKEIIDKSLGDKAIVSFISKYNIFVYSSNYKGDSVCNPIMRNDGMWETKIFCKIEKYYGNKREFQVRIKGTTHIGKVIIPLKSKSSRRLFYQVELLKYWLYVSNLGTLSDQKNSFYPIAGKACVDFLVPQNIRDLKIKYSEGIGGKYTVVKNKDLITHSLEVDCKKLKNTIDKINNKADFDNEIPQPYIILYADSSNGISLDKDIIEKLTYSKGRVVININDGLTKHVSGNNPPQKKKSWAFRPWSISPNKSKWLDWCLIGAESASFIGMVVFSPLVQPNYLKKIDNATNPWDRNDYRKKGRNAAIGFCASAGIFVTSYIVRTLHVHHQIKLYNEKKSEQTATLDITPNISYESNGLALVLNF